MHAGISSSLDLLEKRLALMQQLAEELKQGQIAIIARDLVQIECHTASQNRLCGALRELEKEQAWREETEMAGQIKNDSAPAGCQQAIGQLAEVENQVAYLGRVHASLLRRAQRTVSVFVRLLASSGVTYEPPEAAGNQNV
jgi:porphobilinogen deaminase